jgi:hypothetical protein
LLKYQNYLVILIVVYFFLLTGMHNYVENSLFIFIADAQGRVSE